MKILSIVLVFVAVEALAFDPALWLKRRAEFREDAMRLRASYSNVVARVFQPAENVSVPIEVYPDGSVKTLISARLAQVFLDEKLVWGADVAITQNDEKGVETLRIESAKLLFDRERKRGWVEGSAKVTRGRTVFTGTNVYIATDEEYVLSLDASSLESADLRIGGVR